MKFFITRKQLLFLVFVGFLLLPTVSEAAYRSSTTNSGSGGGASTAVPSGATTDDIVVCVVSNDNISDSFTWPSGFVELYDVDNSADGHSHGVAWKRLTTTDVGSYTVTHGGSVGDWVMQCAAFSGRSVADDPTATNNSSNSANSSPVSVNATGLTATEGDDILWIGALDTTSGSPSSSFSAPTDYTERQDTNNAWSSVSVASRDNVSAGSTGTVTGTATLGTGNAGWHAFLVSMPAAPVVPTTSSLAKPPNNLGLVGYWSFNEGNGTIATDFSGNGNYGTLSTFTSPASNSSGWTNQGKRGGALHFDGSSDIVTAGDINATDLASALTISMWVKPDSLSDWMPLMSKCDCDGGTANWNFGLSNSGNGSNNDFSFFPDGSNGAYTTGDYLVPGQWTHVVAVFDGTQGTASNRVTFYVNGTAVSKGTFGTLPTQTTSNAIDVALGQHGGSTGDPFFDGVIDDARLYTRALGATEVATLYESGAVKLGASSKTLTSGSTLRNGLVGHWSMDGGDTNWTSETAGTMTDGSGTGNTGTMTNMVRNSAVSIGKLGQAFNFDGTDDYLIVTDHASLDITADISMTAWIKRDTSGTFDGIISKTDGGEWAYEMYICGTGSGCTGAGGTDKLTFESSNTGREFSTGTITDTEWHHVAIIRSGTTFTFYIDGAQSGTSSDGTALPSTADPLLIGSDIESSCGVFCFDGLIDDVRLYNRALTGTEVKQLYNLGKAIIVQ